MLSHFRLFVLFTLLLLLSTSFARPNPTEAQDSAFGSPPAANGQGRAEPEFLPAVNSPVRAQPRAEGSAIYEFYTVWHCVGEPGQYCSGSGSSVTHDITVIEPSEATVSYLTALPAQDYCTINNPHSVFCDLGFFYVGQTVTVRFTVEHSLDAVRFTHVATSNIGSWPHVEEVATPECTTVGAVEVCANDLTPNEDETLFTGTSGITIADVLSISSGSVTVDKTDNSVTGSGSPVYYNTTGKGAVALWDGNFLFDSAMTNSGNLNFSASGGTLAMTHLSDVEINTATLGQISVEVSSSSGLKIEGGELLLHQPFEVTLNLNRYRLDPAGTPGGSVQPFNIPLIAGTIDVSKAEFNDEGLTTEGDVFLLHLGVNYPASFKGIIMTSTAMKNADLEVPGLGVNASRWDGIQIGPATFKLGTGQMEVADTREQGLEWSIRISDVTLELDERLIPQDFRVPGETPNPFKIKVGLRLYQDDVDFLQASVELPPLKVYKYTLAAVKVSIEKKAEGGYSFSGEGMLEVPNFIPRSQSDSVGLFFSVTVSISADSLTLDNIAGGLRGLEIPLGTTGVFLTSFTGAYDNEQRLISGTAGLDLGPKSIQQLLGFALLSGDVTLGISANGWGELDGAMTMLDAFPVGSANLSVNKPGVSENGARGTITVNALDILIGTNSVWVGTVSPYFKGRGHVTLQIPFDQLPAPLAYFVPEESFQIADIGSYIGDFDGQYGIGAHASIPLGDSLINFPLCVFINAQPNVSFSCGWVNSERLLRGEVTLPTVRSVNTGISARAGRAATTSIEITDGVEVLTFSLSDAEATSSALELVDPSGTTIDSTTVTGFSNIVYGQNAGGVAYFVSNPSAGLWTANVIGSSTTVPQIDVRNGMPSVRLRAPEVLEDGRVKLRWTATDADSPDATVNLYYDTDALVYDGTQIASGLPASAAKFNWTPQGVPAHTHYLYAEIVDGANIPQVSAYTQGVVLGDTTAPAAPTGVVANVVGDTVNMSWAANSEPDLDGYKVYIQYSRNAGYQQVMETSTNSVTFTRLDPSQRMKIRVRAVDSAGNLSPASPRVKIAANDVQAPAAPTRLTAVYEEGKILLNWRDNTDADHYDYRVYYGYGTNTSFDHTFTAANSEAIIAFPETGRTIYVAVTARDYLLNESVPSNVASALVSEPVVNAPTGLSVSNTYGTDLYLEWTDNSDIEESYQIERTMAGANNWQIIANRVNNATTYTDTTPECGVVYQYRVRAFTSVGNLYSTYSSIASGLGSWCYGQANALSNTSFETRGPDGVPADWAANGLSKHDKRMCGYEAEPAFDNCIFRFVGEAGENSSIQQRTPVAASAGDTLTISAWVKSRKGGGPVMRATIEYDDGTSQEITVNAPKKTKGEYVIIGDSRVLSKDVRRVTVILQYTKATGSIDFDGIVVSYR